MNERERREVEHDVYVSLRDHIAALRTEDQRRLDERFKAQERALKLMTSELARRLQDLNHAHQQAREKERDFIGREAFETHVAANLRDHTDQRREVQQKADALSQKVDDTAKALATAFTESQTIVNTRLGTVESFVQKVLGLTLAVPFVTALVVYLVTR